MNLPGASRAFRRSSGDHHGDRSKPKVSGGSMGETQVFTYTTSLRQDHCTSSGRFAGGFTASSRSWKYPEKSMSENTDTGITITKGEALSSNI